MDAMNDRPHNLSQTAATGLGRARRVHVRQAVRAACSRAAHVRRAGFTLTEVLISMALVAVLLVGLGRIFQITSDTIKTGQAYQTALRKQKAVYTALSKDFLGYASNGNIAESDNGSGIMPISKQPFLLISNYRAAAPINSNDRTTGSVPAYLYGTNNWRLDTLGFFSRGDFSRQTGSPDPSRPLGDRNDPSLAHVLVAPLQSRDAFVWYGHLRIFNSNLAQIDLSAGYGNPAETTSPNNQYAEQFALGRVALVLRPPAFIGAAQAMFGDDGKSQSFFTRSWTDVTDNIASVAGVGDLDPIQYGSNAGIFQASSSTTVALTNYRMEQARIDVVATDAATFRERLIAMLRDYQNTDRTSSSGATSRGATPQIRTDKARNTWYVGLFGSHARRFWVNPFPTRPVNYVNASQLTQLLAQSVSQFTVEFAGDYFTQSAAGAITAVAPDGVIDFAFIDSRRVTKWYGLPRDVNGDGTILGRSSETGAGVSMNTLDVVPVRDVSPVVYGPMMNPDSSPLTNYSPARHRAYQFEKVVPPYPASGLYEAVTATVWSGEGNFRYICAWGPEDLDGAVSELSTPPAGTNPPNGLKTAPKLIRVIVEVRDPAGSLATPVTQEYVFPVPQQ